MGLWIAWYIQQSKQTFMLSAFILTLLTNTKTQLMEEINILDTLM